MFGMNEYGLKQSVTKFELLYLNQGIPFLISILNTPKSINTDEMTTKEIRALFTGESR